MDIENVKIGEQIILLKENDTDGLERLSLDIKNCQGETVMKLGLPWDIVDMIYRWKKDQIDLEDIDMYIQDVREEAEDQYRAFTADKMQEVREELLVELNGIRDNDDGWYRMIRSAVKSYGWDHREELEGPKKTYWLCPTDSYGQRNGDVHQVELTEWEYQQRRKHQFLYDNYVTALAAAQD